MLCASHHLTIVWSAPRCRQHNNFSLLLTLPVPGTPQTVWSLLAGPDGTFVAGCSGGVLVVYAGSGNVVKELVGHTRHVVNLTWLADPNFLVRARAHAVLAECQWPCWAVPGPRCCRCCHCMLLLRASVSIWLWLCVAVCVLH